MDRPLPASTVEAAAWRRQNRSAASATSSTAIRATLLLNGFRRPPRLAPLLASVTAEEVRERFAGGWELDGAEPVTAGASEATGRQLRGGVEVWRFRLCRRP